MNDKYIVFKREDFYEMLSDLQPQSFFEKFALKDAVVIRRQDKFAAPCLDVYAQCIALVAGSLPEIGDLVFEKEDLMRIADYFADQARLAHEEGFKFPD